MNVIDILDRLPFELAARLQADPFFIDIPIIVAVKGNLASEFQRRQAVITEKTGKRGVAVFVLQIVADDKWDGLPGAPMILKPSFQVVENVELNNDRAGTEKSARKIARRIILNLKLTSFRGIVQGLTTSKPAIEPAEIKDLGDAVVAEQVNFECQEFSDEKISYVLPPIAAVVPGSNPPAITLTSATPGAAVWYTTDESYPFPGNADQFPGSTSQLYCQPIAMALGVPQVFRAAAYVPGSIDSSIERFTITITSQP